MTADLNSHLLEQAISGVRHRMLQQLQSFENHTSISPNGLDATDWWSCILPHLPVEQVSGEELSIIVLALIPHIRPHFFDNLIQSAYPSGGNFPHLGGIRGKGHRGFMPTGETALFLLAGVDFRKRFEIQRLFDPDHWFASNQVLRLANPERNEPQMSGQLILENEYVERLTLGKISRPRFSSEFPASRITTEQEWQDLILPHATFVQIEDILKWLRFKDLLSKDPQLKRRLKPGYRALFHGPPGTGKTLTANLLGKYTDRDIYRVDLSSLVSKYIGETEKNLANLFDRAENKDWILFFDEADALFGRRTQVQNAHDRYANQEVAYLLQRIENYKGLIILATNFKSNIDEAFMRRFQSIIHFPRPRMQERLLLWQQSFPERIEFMEEVSFEHIAKRFEVTGADIMNVVQYVSLNAFSQNEFRVGYETIADGIKREFAKSGKLSN